MKTVILDENLPVELRHHLSEFKVFTISYLGWNGTANGKLVSRMDGEYDVLVSGDKGLRYQQNLVGRSVAIVEIPGIRLKTIMPHIDRITAAIRNAKPGSYTTISGN